MSSTDTERLEREAEARRSSVNDTIEELRNRMSPGQILDEVTDYFGKGQANAAVQNLGRQVRDNPLALGLVGAGLAWLVLGKGVRDSLPDHDRHDTYGRVSRASGYDPYPPSGSESYRAFDRDDYDSSPGIGERVGDAASGAVDSLSSAASSVASGLSNAASRVGASASSVGGSVRNAQGAAFSGARHAGESAYRTGARARRGFLDTLQEEPLVFGAIALAVGAAIGASLPSTSVEDEYLGDTGDRLREQARDYGRQAFENAKDVAAETYKAASDEAERQGLKPSGDGETLASKVSSVVGAATDAARERSHTG